MEEGTLDALDHSDFVDTDIPFEVPVPSKLCVTVRDPSTEHFKLKHPAGHTGEADVCVCVCYRMPSGSRSVTGC